MISAKNKHCDRVVAFEPVRRTADLCAANFSINKVQDKITLVRKAISDKTGNAEMSVNRHHSGRASIAQTNTNTFTDIENIEVVNHEGLNELHLDPSVPVYIKIDVEGHEEIVLKELFLSRIAGQIQQIYYECDEKWISPESVEEWLKQKGFSINKMGQEEHYNVLATRQGDRID